MFRHI